ncbi:hypothetical protein KEH51_22050 [[Brevibacterium] frigoritolerans]|uniref:Uncharacterized protein n=1 Tax=Peribacillus frigoritolerans TaxID=450367 RepID=A0A941JBF5_9BACI|nr:hypothetical protein [Peribacillus frigoritolerans]
MIKQRTQIFKVGVLQREIIQRNNGDAIIRPIMQKPVMTLKPPSTKLYTRIRMMVISIRTLTPGTSKPE